MNLHEGNYIREIDNYITKFGFNSFTPEVVLFDMDGVLYDSMPNHAIAWVEAMKKFGLTMTTMDSYKYEGMRGVETIQIIVKEQLGKDINEDEAQKIYDEKARLFGLLPHANIMPGIIELMQKIKSCGIEIGIVTGSGQRPLIQRLIEDFHEFVDDEHIVTAYDVSRGKPDPEPYLMGLQKAGSKKPWQGIVVENAPLGIRAGVAAQIFTIAVNSGPLPDSSLAAEGANLVFGKMTELCDNWEKLILAR